MKKKKLYYVNVNYPIKYWNYDFDQKIIKTFGIKYESGSGAGFGSRDVNFCNVPQSVITKARSKLPRYCKINKYIEE